MHEPKLIVDRQPVAYRCWDCHAQQQGNVHHCDMAYGGIDPGMSLFYHR